MSVRIGIVACHGSREEHAEKMEKLGCDVVFLRSISDFINLDGIILPGGESSSFGRLLEWSDIYSELQKSVCEKKIPVFGTCAGSILLAQEGSDYCMNAIDVKIDRNAYGRQIDSFSEDISIKGISKKFHALFIRAPKILSYGRGIEVLAEYNTAPVLVRSDTVLSCTFHPELTKSTAVHELFLEMIHERKEK